MMTVIRKVSPALLVLTALLVTGCAGREDDLNRYIDEVKARPATPIPPIPAVRTYTPYVYDGLTGRDPFRQSTREGAEQVAEGGPSDGPRPDLQRSREYLERFELDTLTMVGTFAKETNSWALVQDPDGVVHRVAVGNYMGKNHGRVSTISEDEVQLSEFITDGVGGWLVREASIALGGT
ncbi:MAG: pilus assembly protein PilP [Gammaproteobacteria bacterium]|nr:pilus assembly protein PilP [Gammaproteobacteria bacterium]